MAEDISKYRFKQMPTDVWSIREKLALASSVMRSGDQNWVSVSRAIRPFGNPGRPDDWFSQKNCALQYSALLEKVETPRRKRGERDVADTPGDVIVRKLTVERIEELKRIIQEEKNKYRNLKQDLEMVKSGQMDHKIKELWEKMQADKVAAEEAAAKKAAEEKAARDLAKAAAAKQKKPILPRKILIPQSDQEDSTQDSVILPRKILIPQSDQEDSTQDSVSECVVNDDSKQSFVTAALTPGTSRSADPSASTPSSPLLSLLLSNASKPLGDVANSSPTKNAEQIGIVSAALIADDIKEEVVEDGEFTGRLIEASSDAIIGLEETVDASAVEDGLDLNSSAAVRIEELKMETTSSLDMVHQTASDWESAAATANKLESEARVEDDKHQELKSPSLRSNQVETKDDVGPKVEASVAEDVMPMRKPSTSVDEMEEVAASPASSVLSAEHTPVPSKTVSSRSTRADRSRRGQRKSARSRPSEDGKEVEVASRPSEAETSDDDAASSRMLDESNASDLFSSSARQKIDMLNESLPNSPASFSHSDTEDEKAHKIWKKSIMLVYRSAATHKFANTFMHKVNEDIAPGYHSIVHRPMDLSTIKKNIDSGMIRTTAEFQRDMMLMFINAMMYNSVEHDVHQMAVEMYSDVMTHIEHFVNTQMMVQAEPKLLRTLRRSDAHSDKQEEDQRKRKTSEAESQPTPTSAAKKRR